MSVAERTREAVRDHPFLYDALGAGVVNYTAAARFLDLGETDAVATALRRFADELEYDVPDTGARVTMDSGFGRGDPADALLVVGDTALVPGEGSLTAVVATGAVTPGTLRTVLGRCAVADVAVEAAAVAGDTLVVAVPRRDGPDALRHVEDAL